MSEDSDIMSIGEVEVNDKIQEDINEALEYRMVNFSQLAGVDDIEDVEIEADVVIFIDAFDDQPLEAETDDSAQMWLYDYETLAKTPSWNVVQTIVEEADIDAGLYDIGIRELDGENCIRTVEFHPTEVEKTWRSTLEYMLEQVFKSWMH